MLYTKVTKRCSAVRLSRDEARVSLEQQFDGSEILDLKRRGDKWVATLLMPHEAEFPPKKDGDNDSDDSESPKSESPEPSSPSEESDSGPSDGDDGPPKADKPPHKGPEGEGAGGLDSAVAELTTLVHAIADKLGIGPGPMVPGAEDVAPPLPDGPPPAPPGAAGPAGPAGPEGHQEIVHRTKMHPGDTPPGVTPIGSPAFASVEASVQRMASFDAFDDTPGKSIKQAKEELEALYGPMGFKVRQIKRVENGQRLAAKLSRR
jgi:hypothetical protein